MLYADTNEQEVFSSNWSNLFDAIEKPQRTSDKNEKVFFVFLFDKLNPHAHIRTFTQNIDVFELDALKLHHERVVCCFAIHFSPINNFRIRLASFSILRCVSLAHWLVRSLGGFVYSGQPKIDVSRS